MITSLQHPIVKHFVKLRLDKDYRQTHQRVVIEGLKPIQELLPYITQLLYTSHYTDLAQQVKNGEEVTEAIIQKVSGMSSPEGVIAEVIMPTFVELKECSKIVAFDGISDPGNLGTLLRTALALGWEGAYFLPGGCDPFNEKVLRAARGAHFKLKLREGSAKELKILCQDQHLQPWVADIKGQAVNAVHLNSKQLLVLGNEAHGASITIKEFCQSLTIPMSNQMESLNVAVAGSILLYLLGKEG